MTGLRHTVSPVTTVTAPSACSRDHAGEPRIRTRPPDRLVVHGAAVEFRELCRRAVPPETRYLVLDLDRTVHLGRNMGELLGWEVGAYHAYGPEHLARAEPRRAPGRFFLDWSRPLAALRYLLLGVTMWALPGLFYLFSWKIPGRFRWGRRWSFRAFGVDPVARVQQVPQTTLMRHLAGVPADVLRTLAQRVWDRHAPDQVIERQDLEWLRQRCPGLRIVIASASPQPTVEVAAAALGADDVLYSTLERINSSRAKIERLRARYPDLADPATVSVGITDTGYGEDHCWTGHLTRVIDVNSSTPFPPLVPASSPLREVHSAAVLTRRERARRAQGEEGWLDPRRLPRDDRDRAFEAPDLARGLGSLAERVERLTAAIEEREAQLAAARAGVVARAEVLARRIERLVRSFDDAAAGERRAALARLRRELRRSWTLQRELARIERPVSALACAVAGLLADARAALGGTDARRQPVGPRPA